MSIMMMMWGACLITLLQMEVEEQEALIMVAEALRVKAERILKCPATKIYGS
jgi:hypothetical protein